MSAHQRTLLALFFLVIIWAYSWIIMKQMMQYADPFDFSALRYFGGALVLFVILLATGRSLNPPPLLPTLTVGLAQTAAFQGFAQWALVSGGAGKIALFCYTMPFWSVLLAWWWFKEKPNAWQLAGLSLAALGLLLIIAPWQSLPNGTSILLAIVAGIFWATGTVLSKKLFEQQPKLSLLNFTTWQMFLGALVLCLLAWLVPSKPIQWTGEFIWGLAYSVLLASSVAWLLWQTVVRNLPTSVAGLSSLLVPLTAILLAWLLLQEVPSYLELLGIGCIMLGLLVVRPGSRKSGKSL